MRGLGPWRFDSIGRIVHEIVLGLGRFGPEKDAQFVTFLVYYTMASQEGREIVNREVAGSILAVFPLKRRKKRGLSHVPRTCKTPPLQETMEGNAIIAKVTTIPKIGGKTG